MGAPTARNRHVGHPRPWELVRGGEGENVGEQGGEEVVGVDEDGEVAAGDGNEGFLWGVEGIEIFMGQAGGGGEVFGAFEEKHGDGEMEAEVFHGGGFGLRDELIGAEDFAIESVVEIADGVTGRLESEADRAGKEEIGVFEAVGPFALGLVALEIGVGRWADGF